MHPIQEKLLKLSRIRDLSRLSYREIGRQLREGTNPSDRVHPTNVKYHLEQLIASGDLAAAHRPVIRSAQPSTKIMNLDSGFVRIPIVGSANCGPATIFADDKIEGYIQISPSILRAKNHNDLYALRAVGSSMNRTEVMGKTIDSGDFVIIDSSKVTPRDGERVLIVRDNTANIKQIFFDHEEEVIVLKSESSVDYSPIFISPDDEWDTLIRGTVIQVVKTSKRSFA